MMKREDFNTNNAWGFGGAIGTKYTLKNGYYIRKGRAYFRHIKTESFTKYYDSTGKEISKVDWLAVNLGFKWN